MLSLFPCCKMLGLYQGSARLGKRKTLTGSFDNYCKITMYKMYAMYKITVCDAADANVWSELAYLDELRLS